MNKPTNIKTGYSVCPHDCPSACALEVEVLDEHTIGRLRGAKDQTYTAGVICEKVARYAERIHHPDRLTRALKRKGEKGGGEWQEIGFDDALDEVAEAFERAEARHGAETVWPYYYAGTMGLVMRDGIHRLTHAKKYSRMYDTFCVTLAWPGYIAGTGRLYGPDPREMAQSDLVVIWGTNPVNTQVNVMTHAMRARRERGAKIAVVDVYETGTMKQADVGLILKPGTDAALACAVMHVLFRDGLADRAYMAKFADCPQEFEAHLKTRTPDWAARITGLTVEEIEAFARLIGETGRTYIRMGYGFTRHRNGAVAMHAVTSIATVAGLWPHEGAGAFHSNSGMYRWNKTMIEGLDVKDATVRWLDQSRIGAVLTGDAADIGDGPPVTAMILQNTNPVSVAPDQDRVKRGFARDDLFVCVHEQFVTETAEMADIVLPATMFLEHDDLYQGGGHQYAMFGARQVKAPGDCRSNHQVVCGLADRLGAEHPGFGMSVCELIDWTLTNSGKPALQEMEERHWVDCQPDFDTSHYVNGFGHKDGKYRFRPDWHAAKFRPDTGLFGPVDDMPAMPDHWAVIETADKKYPFRLATSPARTFLNSSFNETPTSRKREGRPTVLMHPDDMAELGLGDGHKVRMGSPRGEVRLHVAAFAGLKRGVVISEGIFPNDAFEDGKAINTLTAADQPAPVGGGLFHDTKVWVKAV
jgi:anaerobic selenocysteine-containing dehydrogenase